MLHVRQVRISSIQPDSLACGAPENPRTIYTVAFTVDGRMDAMTKRLPYSDVERLMQRQGVRHFSALAGRSFDVPFGFTSLSNAVCHVLYEASHAPSANFFRPAKPRLIIVALG